MTRGILPLLLGVVALLAADVSAAAGKGGKKKSPFEGVAPADGPSAGPGYALPSPAELVLEVREDTPPGLVGELGSIPGAEVLLVLEGNMVPERLIPILRKAPRATVRVVTPLLPVHVEQLRRLPDLGVELALRGTALPEETRRRLEQLGPRRLTVFLNAEAQGLEDGAIEKLPQDARVRIFFGRRTPGPTELDTLALRPDGAAMVEFLGDARPEAIRAAIAAGLTVRVASKDDRVAPELLAELEASKSPVCVELSGEPAHSDVERLAGIPRLGKLWLRLDRLATFPPGLKGKLGKLAPRPL